MLLSKKLTAFALACCLALALPCATRANELSEFRFASFSGSIVSVEERSAMTYVLMSGTDEQQANLIITPASFVADNVELTPGAKITGFYDGSAPMLMIYPPQYNAEAVVVQDELESIKYSIFDDNLVSADGMLKLNISEDTLITAQDGSEFSGDFIGKRVLVSYGVSTRSIPAQTTPSSIIVLSDIEPPTVQELDPDANLLEPEESIEYGISSFANDDILLKLRSAAQELELNLDWIESEGKIIVGDNITITIGSPIVDVNGLSVSLSAPPQIVNGFTYVPLDFFTGALALNIIQ